MTWKRLTLATCALGLMACTEKPTEIVAGVSTQIRVPDYLKSVVVIVQRSGSVKFEQTYPVDDGTVTLPSTLGVERPEEDANTDPVTVQVLGWQIDDEALDELKQSGAVEFFFAVPDTDDEPGIMLVRRGRQGYTSDRITYLPLPLRESCTGVACEDGQTCAGGACVDQGELNDNFLIDYADSLIFGNTNTCFSTSTCMSPQLTVPANIEDPDNCTFSLPLPDGAPMPDPGNMNVRIVYSSFGTEVLDLDPIEGFTFPDANDSLTFQLAPNLCETNYKPRKILAVSANPTCQSKRALQPICTGDLQEIQAGSIPGIDLPPQLRCTTGPPLVQSESALYILMDRSNAMAEFLGATTLQFAVELQLNNPIAERTQIAFSFVPSAMNECTLPNSYQSPTIGFDSVDSVRQPIADILGDVNNLLMTDPPVFFDAAMIGAYDAISNFMPINSAQFNRRAVLLLGNHDFAGTVANCGTPTDQIAMTAKMSADNIFTYALVLDAPTGFDHMGGDPPNDAGLISDAGGTKRYSAVGDEPQAAIAVQEIVNDLGSCLYDAPTAGPLVDAVELSYLNPVTLVREDIARDDSCSEATADTADGWANQGNGQVRMCGQACATFRQTLSDTSLYFAAQLKAAPAVPVVPTLPCELFEVPAP